MFGVIDNLQNKSIFLVASEIKLENYNLRVSAFISKAFKGKWFWPRQMSQQPHCNLLVIPVRIAVISRILFFPRHS